MHILVSTTTTHPIATHKVLKQNQVTNDDGPPSLQSSPYILPFVHALRAAGHEVTIVIPDAQRSWIGKAHIVGAEIHSTPYWPPERTPSAHDPEAQTARQQGDGGGGDGDARPWILLSSTPATCVQIALSHYLDTHDVDLVISGPNYGRNTTAVFALSSGTLGAALEAAVCGHRAIALSFAFSSRNHDDEIIAETCRHSVRVCEYLAADAGGNFWGEGRLYTINTPVVAGVASKPTIWTRMLQNSWKRGACFQEIASSSEDRTFSDAAHDANAAAEEQMTRVQTEEGGKPPQADERGSGQQKDSWERTRHFKWAPRFTDVFDSVEAAGPGTDGWSVKVGETSVTGIYANFKHVQGLEGEIELGGGQQVSLGRAKGAASSPAAAERL